MKHAKKLASLLLTLVMVFAMSITAFAAQEGTLSGGSITINDAEPGQTYNAYQILYLESYNASVKAYAYKVNPGWADFFKAAEGETPAGAGLTYVAIDSQGYATWKTGADAAAFAKAAQDYAKQQNITFDATATAPASTENQTYSTVTLSNLKLGYYLVDTTLGTLCSLDTTNPNVVMEEKNEKPTNKKDVQEDSDNSWGDANDADIGQALNFKSTITLPIGSENVTLHDTMSNGLTLTANSIRIYTDADMTTELATGNYTVITSPTDSCTFEVSFTQTYLDSLTATSTVYVFYSAIVNNDAVIGLNGNPNTSKLSYGDSSNTQTTPDSTTVTYTWNMGVLKYANGDESKVLENAKFVLLSSNKSKVATIVNGEITGWANVPAAGQDGAITWPDNTVLITGADGKIAIDGLDADTYYLRETAAPLGYNKLANDVEVEITGATIKEGETALTYSAYVAKVENNSGAELPSTGGMGTTVFYVIGSILLVGASVLLIVKKRMSTAK